MKRGGTEMTELKLEFELENAELPIDYDKVILSFMKAAIENFSPDLFDKLYTREDCPPSRQTRRRGRLRGW